jgi:hypothetical protein
MRLRYNPFHAYLEARILDFLGVEEEPAGAAKEAVDAPET